MSEKHPRIDIFYSTVGIGMRRNHFLFGLTDEVVQWLNNGGITDHSNTLFMDMAYKPFESVKEGPQVFKFDDLRYGFEMWLVACGISSFTFASELCVELLRIFLKWLKTTLSDVLGLLLFLKFLIQIHKM